MVDYTNMATTIATLISIPKCGSCFLGFKYDGYDQNFLRLKYYC